MPVWLERNCDKVRLLEDFMENHNQFIQLFKIVPPQLRNNNYQISIKANIVPLGKHNGIFNAPIVNSFFYYNQQSHQNQNNERAL